MNHFFPLFNMDTMSLHAIPGIPHINEGDDIAQIIFDRMPQLEDNDIVVIAQKIISKAEGRIKDLRNVSPSQEALDLSQRTGRDARLCQVIIEESVEILEVKGKVVVTKMRNGMICTSAGVDKSNLESDGGNKVVLLPDDADGSAKLIREKLEGLLKKEIAVIISDSLGHPNRQGAIGQAIGFSGIAGLEGAKGKDFYGNSSGAIINIVDQIASAASILMGQSNEGQPVIVVRGMKYQRDLDSGISSVII
jgi:coenzyme F420-0:L-glutamate ligase / coenzyme F420-1:gamma-L-glutamate ligase